MDELVNDPASPAYTARLPAGISRAEAAERFSCSVLEQQPVRVAGAIAHDAVKLFALTRNTAPGDTPIGRWQFQVTYPSYPPTITLLSASALFRSTGGGGAPTAVRPLAVFLRDYQLHGGYTPGPFLLLSLLAGIGGVAAGIAGAMPPPPWPACWLPARAPRRCSGPTCTSSPGATSSGPGHAAGRRCARGQRHPGPDPGHRRRKASAASPGSGSNVGQVPASASSPTSGPLIPASSTRTPGSG